ncbi:MAG TPA: tetratricopeptide repeat protein [Candidatus Wallbacteria bacterium]|nr:tetratricopeptide repeat protein [Candidatus Wallbacteria bacterium]
MDSNTEKQVKKMLDDGIRFVKGKKLDDAVRVFKQIFVMYPESSLADNAHYNLGMVHEIKKEYSRAFVEYKTILELYPDSDAAIFAKDKVEELNQNLDVAAPEFSIGQNLYLNKKFADAEKVFSEIVAHHPKSDLIDNALFFIGMIKKAKKDYEGAKRIFNDIREKYPDSDAAQLLDDVLCDM